MAPMKSGSQTVSYRGLLQGDVIYILADQWHPSYMGPNTGGGEGVAGVSANENSCAHHLTWSPNKLWRSNSLFNLWCQMISFSDFVQKKVRKDIKDSKR
jgi:hypothetical protein